MNNLFSDKRFTFVVIIVSLLAALGLFVWAVTTQKFEIRKKAVSGEPTPTEIAVVTASPSGSPSATPTSSPSPTSTAFPASCTRGIQSVSLEPSSQTGYRGTGLTYTVTVTNNDDKACDKANFSLSAILPYANWTASFAQTVLSIEPQTSASTTVIFKSSLNSPYGTLPVAVNTVGPKASLVAAANYIVQVGSPTPSPYPTTETIYLKGGNGGTGLTAVESSSPSPTAEVASANETATQTPGGILSSIPTAVIYGVGGLLLIILFFILRALFSGGNKNNPPKMTPPTQTPPTPTPIPPSSGPSMQSQAPQGPQLSHSVDAPLSEF